MHEIKISPILMERAMERRGRIHPFEAVELARTALIVVDMQNGFVDPALSTSVPVARDAAMLNYKVIMVADANAARSDDDHNATLNNLFNIFTDVRTTDEVIALLDAGQAPARRTA